MSLNKLIDCRLSVCHTQTSNLLTLCTLIKFIMKNFFLSPSGMQKQDKFSFKPQSFVGSPNASPYSPIVSPRSHKQLKTQSSQHQFSQHKFFQKQQNTRVGSEGHLMPTLRGVKSLQNLPKLIHQSFTPDRKPSEGHEQKERENELLKTQVRVLSAGIHRIRVERLNPADLQNEIVNESIKNLNLKAAIKNTLIGKVQKTISNFKQEIAQKGLTVSPECQGKMEEVLGLISSHERNIVVRESVREIEQVRDRQRVVVIYREDGCQEDWREWREKYAQSERRIVQLNEEISRLYQHQNQMAGERTQFLESSSLLEVQIRNLKSQITHMNTASFSSDSRVTQLENQKEFLFKNKQELLHANSDLKVHMINFEVRETSSLNRIGFLEKQLEDAKNNSELLSQWRKSHESTSSNKSQQLESLVREAEIKLNSLTMEKRTNQNLMEEKSRNQATIHSLESQIWKLQEEIRQYSNLTRNKILELEQNLSALTIEKTTLIEKVKSVEFQCRSMANQFELRALKQEEQSRLKLDEFHQVSVSNQDFELSELRSKIFDYESQIKRFRTIELDYELQQGTLIKNRATIRKFQEKMMQNSFDLQTLDMIKPRLLSYENTISQLRLEISSMQQVMREKAVGAQQRFHQESVGFDQQVSSGSLMDKLQISTLEAKVYESESEVSRLRQENFIYSSRVKEFELSINNFSSQEIVGHHAGIQTLVERNKETIITLERHVSQYIEQIQGLTEQTSSQQKTIIHLEGKIKEIQHESGSTEFNSQILENPENFNSYHETSISEKGQFKKSTILNSQFVNSESEQIITELKRENQRCKLEIEQAKRQLTQLQTLNNDPSGKDQAIQQLNIGINTLELDVVELHQKLGDKEFTISQLGQALEILEDKRGSEQMVRNHRLFKEACQQVYQMNSDLRELYEEKHTLIEVINRKGAMEIDRKKAQVRIVEIQTEKTRIVMEFESVRVQLISEIREKDELIKHLQALIKDGQSSPQLQDEYFRYKADPRYLQLKTKLYELQKSYSNHNQVTHEFFHQYRKEHLESHERVLDIIRETFAIMKKFEQTVIVKKTTLKRFNFERLRDLKGRIGELKHENLRLRDDCVGKMSGDLELLRRDINQKLDHFCA